MVDYGSKWIVYKWSATNVYFCTATNIEWSSIPVCVCVFNVQFRIYYRLHTIQVTSCAAVNICNYLHHVSNRQVKLCYLCERVLQQIAICIRCKWLRDRLYLCPCVTLHTRLWGKMCIGYSHLLVTPPKASLVLHYDTVHCLHFEIN